MSSFKNINFSPFQLTVLGILTCILCGVCAGIGIVAGRLGFDSPSPAVAAPPTSLPPTSQPEPIPTAAAPSSPTTVVPPTVTPEPTPAPAIAPSPTATFVVAPALINQDKITEIVEFVELNRQLTLPTAVPIKFLTRRQLREQWRDSSFDAAALEAVQTQQEFYRALSLIESASALPRM